MDSLQPAAHPPAMSANMNYHTKNGRTSKRGAFLNRIWHCDCEPRIPADKFQTKNGGKNHGRWFYTCQKPQPKRCGFFLWSENAKVREESAVLNNSRSEPGNEPQTPRKPTSNAHAPLTPQSRERPALAQQKIDLTYTPTAKDAAKDDNSTVDHEDSFEWPSSDEAELAEAAAHATMPPTFETPRKVPRTETHTSSGKRSLAEMQSSERLSTWPLSIPSHGDDVFATPSTSNRSNGLLSPTQTPAQASSRLENTQSLSKSDLATNALKVLAHISLNAAVEEQLVALLDRHDLRTQGIIKGREITRLAIQAKDKKIAELQARIAGLEAERETSRTVIAHLKQDIGVNATSPKKGRGKFAPKNDNADKG